MGFLARIAAGVEQHAGTVLGILEAIPRVPEELSRALGNILSSGPPWLHPALPLAAAGAIALLALAVPALLARAGGEWLRRKLAPAGRLGRALRLIAFDLVAFAIALGLAAVLVNLFFRRELLIGSFAVALVGAALRWRLSMLVPEILLRPRHPELRLVEVGNEEARLVTRVAAVVLGMGILFITAVPVLLRAGLPMQSAQAAALVVGTSMAAGAGYGVHRFFRRRFGLWSVAAQLLVAAVWLAWSAGVAMLDFEIYHGLVWSLAIVAATAALDRLLVLAADPADAGTGAGSATRLLVIATVRRLVLAVAGTAVAVLVGHLWLVDITEAIDDESWSHVRAAVLTALSVLVAGYVIFEVFRAWTQARFGRHYGGSVLPGGDDDLTPASRISSVLPVLQGVLGTLIVTTAVVLALSHLGINVTPLIAGAGIFGLAISFGSQALVRDIVAGLFYMFDDAFRVGEYIAAGKYKGTVERIALRSVRLRHQNGQIHTIPYGQLGAVTNFSRDYQTIKFNLRLARDTDVEKVRKLSKKLGQQMLEDAEIGKEFLQPFKMQGVADIQENALVCRFKFTVRPARPTLVQRETLKRLYRLFTDNGVQFASNAVVVQTPGGVPTEQPALASHAAAGAAASRAEAISQDRLAS